MAPWYTGLTKARAKPGDRQKLTVGGHEHGYETTLAQLRKAKIRLWELANASTDDIEKPQPIRFPEEERKLH